MSSLAHGYFDRRTLVVFGAGYVGGAVAQRAAELGARVIALTRNPAKAAELRASGIETIEADLAGEGWSEGLPRQVDFVLNSVSSGGGGVEGYRHSYVEGMRRVLGWAAQARVGTLVYTSSTSVYPQDGGVPVAEDAATQPAGERAALLLEAEELLKNAPPALGRWFILRLAGIYGPGRHHLLDQLRAGETLAGSGTHRLNLCHRDDIVAAILAGFAAPAAIGNEIFNVADDAPATRGEIAGWLAAQLQLPPPRFDAAKPALRRGAAALDRVILNGKLKQALGWRPAYPGYRAGYANLLSH